MKCNRIVLGLTLALGAALPVHAATAPAVPSSYVGELPGASGTMRLHIDLLPGGRYQMRRSFVDRSAPDNRFDDIGRWRFDARSGRLVLQGARESTSYFGRAGSGLRKLDAKGKRIVSASGHNDRLRRLPKAAPIEPRLPLAGMFTYLADAPRIVLCANGQGLAVAQEGAYLPLERAYLDVKGQGKPILAQLEGTLTRRVGGEESLGPQPALVVERFDRLWPGKTCRDKLPRTTPTAASTAADAAPLRGTTWNLVQLGGTPASSEGRRAHLVLDPNEPRVSGSGGCNRLMGGFAQDGSVLRFTGVAGTRMACPRGVMAAETALLQALGKVASWRIAGSMLELADAQGAPLARFEAAPATPPLRGTTWNLVQLAGQTVVTPADARAPHLVLDAKDPTYAGSSGCNRLLGNFELEGPALRFKGGGMTMMACAPELMQREQALGQAMEKTTAWRQEGAALDLLAGEGKLLARFEAPRK